MSEKLENNIGVLTLSNSHALIIQPTDSGDAVRYQFDYGYERSEIEVAEIEYVEHEDYEEELVPAFKVQSREDSYYYLHDFMKV